jgi:ribosome maturation factor RimP
VNLDDCTRFSHAIEAILDARDLVPGAYVLEISSPGIERELYSLADFQRFTGELARVRLNAEIDGQKNFVGRIAAVADGTIEIEDRTRGKVTFPYSSVAKANLKIDLGKELKGRQE